MRWKSHTSIWNREKANSNQPRAILLEPTRRWASNRSSVDSLRAPLLLRLFWRTDSAWALRSASFDLSSASCWARRWVAACNLALTSAALLPLGEGLDRYNVNFWYVKPVCVELTCFWSLRPWQSDCLIWPFAHLFGLGVFVQQLQVFAQYLCHQVGHYVLIWDLMWIDMDDIYSSCELACCRALTSPRWASTWSFCFAN